MRKVIGICLTLLASCAFAVEKTPGYAIASASPHATKAGMAILAKGGNAFDAAVAVTAVLAVTEPYHSGLGGGGFWLLYDAIHDKNVFIDGREVAPNAASPDMYLNSHGKIIKDLSLFGPLAAAIPGEPAAMVYISQHYGKLPLAEVLRPAIELAEKGFLVDEAYRYIASNQKILPHLSKYPSSSSIFLEGGQPPKVGYRIVQKDLAQTLTKIAQQGHKGFYEGEVASKLVNEVRKGGGIWQLADLKEYKVMVREPLVGEYKGVQIITSPPPSAGGVSLLTMLGLLKHYPLHTFKKVMQIHYIVEAMRLAYWDRSQFLGDPDFVDLPIKKLLAASHLTYLRQFIVEDKATPSSTLVEKKVNFQDTAENTTHFSIIDQAGNRVAATLSINYLFGSSYVAEGTGILLNNEMNDFAIKPGTKNVFGLVGGISNKIEPKKRPLSSMAPTFLLTHSSISVLGTPGGSRIPTMLLLSTLAFANGQGPITFVSMPRYHHQYLPDIIEYEKDALDERTKAKLLAMGYHLNLLSTDYGGRSYVYGDMQAVQWDKETDSLIAASDPRHIGLAEVHYMEKSKANP